MNETDSLKLELDGERHCHRHDNEHLLARAQRAEREVWEVRARLTNERVRYNAAMAAARDFRLVLARLLTEGRCSPLDCTTVREVIARHSEVMK